jgi:glyoxylase-like metal-dependent hydrolase (beta-lactamase superfamily II)
MPNNIFPFTIGKLECKVIVDIPSNGVESSLDCMCLFVKTLRNNVLIDTGAGTDIEPFSGKLLENMELAGISRRDVDIVVFTHAHPDHIGGNTDANGQPIFSNARYIMSRKEWEYWLYEPIFSPKEEAIKPVALDSIQKHLRAIQDRFELIEVAGEKELIPGITLIEASGHSPGLIALRISSGSEQLICISDIFHQPAELNKLEWSIITGNLTEQAIRTRYKILSMASTGAMVFAGHFPYPGLGHVETRSEGWFWKQLKYV